MAFIVARPRGRWEIRESILTAKGPRARTLVSFTQLSDATIERARGNARTSFDSADVLRAARRAGVPFERAVADKLAEDLLRCISRGQLPRPGLQRLLQDRLSGHATDESLSDWIGATREERGAALVDLLGLVDRLPKMKKKAKQGLSFPGLSRARLSP